MTMELLDRYLHAVSNHLPQKQRADIVAELSDTLQSQMEEKSEAVGRPLIEDEQAEMLRACGHPVLVAGRYLPQQYLIGPALFPYFWFALKRVLALAFLLQVLVGLAALAGGQGFPGFIRQVAQFPDTALFLGAALVVLFAAFERYQKKMRVFDAWDPRRLPPVLHERPVPRFASGLEIVLNLGFICWALDLPGVRDVARHLFFRPVIIGIPVAASPAWPHFLPPLILIAGINLLQGLATYGHPEWTRLRKIARVTTNVILIGVVYHLSQAGPLVVLLGNVPAALATAEQMVRAGLWATAAIAAVNLFKDLRELLLEPARG
jgi:hypothetical protein